METRLKGLDSIWEGLEYSNTWILTSKVEVVANEYVLEKNEFHTMTCDRYSTDTLSPHKRIR